MKKSTANPYRPGSNLYFILEELKIGGTRDLIAERVLPQLTMYPRKGEDKDNLLKIVHTRILSILRNVKNLGWEVEQEGRGPTQYVKVYDPND